MPTLQAYRYIWYALSRCDPVNGSANGRDVAVSQACSRLSLDYILEGFDGCGELLEIFGAVANARGRAGQRLKNPYQPY